AYLLEKVGTLQEVMVQGEAKRGRGLVSGWTEQRETVVLPGDASLTGEIAPVRITGLSGITLHGEIERADSRDRGALLELSVLDAIA
ncbi:MAG TPA: TRAM domain-containing protein, partial [Gemmatimonadota bacterium]|nr:TRAM domain-containing protein [Gemmatimonadota bacterium]